MRKYENECVGCPPEMGCMISCPYKNVPRDYCDVYTDRLADCKLDGEDMCEDCANEYLQGIFDELNIREKAEALEINFSEL